VAGKKTYAVPRKRGHSKNGRGDAPQIVVGMAVMLFDDEYLDEASARRASPVVKAVRSEQAKVKDATRRAEDGLPVHSFRTLLKDLATLTYNITHTALNPEAKITLTTRPTPIQTKAFTLLGLNPACTQ
jgi:hypothetical protein